MVYQTVPDTAEVTINALLAGQRIQNTYHFTNADAWTAAALGSLCDDVMTTWNAYVPTNMSTAYAVTSVEARGLRSESDVYSFSAITPAAGANTGATLPNNVVLSVARLSGLTGRSFRGRVYIPVTVQAFLTGVNAVSSTFVTAVEAALNNLRVAGTSEGWANVIVSRKADGVLRTVGITTPVLSYQVRDNTLDSQRRRLPGRGA